MKTTIFFVLIGFFFLCQTASAQTVKPELPQLEMRVIEGVQMISVVLKNLDQASGFVKLVGDFGDTAASYKFGRSKGVNLKIDCSELAKHAYLLIVKAGDFTFTREFYFEKGQMKLGDEVEVSGRWAVR
jgi:hypothetical protein